MGNLFSQNNEGEEMKSMVNVHPEMKSSVEVRKELNKIKKTLVETDPRFNALKLKFQARKTKPKVQKLGGN